MRGVRPSLRDVSARSRGRPRRSAPRARSPATRRLDPDWRRRSEPDRLERAAQLACRAADQCLELERMLLERRAAVHGERRSARLARASRARHLPRAFDGLPSSLTGAPAGAAAVR